MKRSSTRTGGARNVKNRKAASNNNSSKDDSIFHQVDIVEQVIQRTFFPREEGNIIDWRASLPRLTSSDCVNKELYALLGLIIRQFVNSWYTRISDNPSFVFEITQTISAVTQQVECRVLALELEEVLLDDLPYVLDAHIQDYRLAARRFRDGLVPCNSLEETFDTIRPHIANNPENEQLFLKLLGKGITLALLHDSEAGKSACSTTLVSSIVSDIALKNAVEKLSEPWMIYEIITKVIGLVKEKLIVDNNNGSTKITAKHEEIRQSITEQVGILYNTTISKIYEIVAAGSKAFAYMVSSSSGEQEDGHSQYEQQTPLVLRSIFPLIDDILQVSQRKPLLGGLVVSLAKTFFTSGRLEKTTSNIAASIIHQHVRNDELVATVLRAARENLFPNNGNMGPPRVYPDEAEQTEIYERARQELKDLIPERIRGVVIGKAETDEIVTDLLDVFAKKHINKSLVYNLLDYTIVTLIPELIENSPEAFKMS